MKYSESRLRRALAFVRIVLGFVYICFGYEKLFDAAFFENGFMQRLAYWEISVAPAYSWMWHILSSHPGRWAVFFGGLEMFIGVALLLGLATRPACLLGMMYMAHRFLLAWYPDDSAFMFWRFVELHFEQIALFSLFLLMAAGHAGDVWGLGAIYHRFHLRWRSPRPERVQYSYFDSHEEDQVESSNAESSDEAEVYKPTA